MSAGSESYPSMFSFIREGAISLTLPLFDITGGSKKESEADEDEPKAKKARGRPKAPNAGKKPEKAPKKVSGGRGRPAKGGNKKKAAENDSDGADGNTEAEESGDHAEN